MRKMIIRQFTPTSRDGTLKALINYDIGFHLAYIRNPI
jgi:hypothetical protein